MKSLSTGNLVSLAAREHTNLPLPERLSLIARQELPKAATRAMTDGKRPCRKSHAAGLLTASGEFVVGVNRKYSHSSLACCAEDGALGALVTLGFHKIIGAATYSPDYGPEEFPELCGRCRDLLIEYLSAEYDEVTVVMLTPHGEKVTTVSGGFCAKPFSGDAKRNGNHSTAGFLSGQLEAGEWERFSVACTAGEFDSESLSGLREQLRNLVHNSTYAHVKDSGVEPEAAAVIGADGNVYFGVSVRSGNPPFSLSALRVAMGTAVAAGCVNFIAALLHVQQWDKNRDWKLLLDPCDIGRLQRTHLHPDRHQLELCVSVGNELLKRATLLPINAF